MWRHWITVLCIALGPAAAADPPPADLRAQAEALLDAWDVAARAENAEQMATLLADDARIVLMVPDAAGVSSERTLSKAEFADFLRRGFDLIEHYDYRRAPAEVSLTDDGARVQLAFDVQESMTVQGQPQSSATYERIEVALRDDRAQIVDLHVGLARETASPAATAPETAPQSAPQTSIAPASP